MKAKEGRELKFDIIGNKDLFKVQNGDVQGRYEHLDGVGLGYSVGQSGEPGIQRPVRPSEQ